MVTSNLEGMKIQNKIERELHMYKGSPKVDRVTWGYHWSRGVIWSKAKNPQKWVAGLGLPSAERAKNPWTSWMFNFGGFTDSPHPHKQETRGLDAIQATSFLPWWLLNFEATGDSPKILKSGKILKNHSPAYHFWFNMHTVANHYPIMVG